MTPKSAEKELKRVIDLEWIVKDSRRSHVLYASHAKALLETEDFSAAMQAIEKSLARKPDRADGARHLLRFQIMLGLGLHDEIIAALDELQVTTELPGRFCLVLGRALENQGNKARARNVYEDMIKSDRSAVGAQRRLRAMERVEVSS